MTLRTLKLVSYLVLFGLLILGPPLFPSYFVTLLSSIVIFSLFVGSLNLLTGYTGLTSLGHGIFWGVGAYAVAILTTQLGVKNFFWVFCISILVVLVIGGTLGLVAVRVKRVYFMILTFALGHVFWCIAMYPIQSITFGYDGIKGITRPQLGFSLSLEDGLYFYYFLLVIAGLCFYLIRCIINSPFGYALIGIRDNEHRMVALGYNTFLYKYICFIVAGLFGGVSGILFAYFNCYVNPSELHWLWSGEALMMLFIGGVGTFWGPLLGASVYTCLRYFISGLTMYWFGIEGIIFIFVVLFFHEGLGGFLNQVQNRLKNGSSKTGKDLQGFRVA